MTRNRKGERLNRESDFTTGISLVGEFLKEHGFELAEYEKIEDRGYSYRAKYRCGHRAVELHYCFSLYKVVYQIDEYEIDHETYVDSVSSKKGRRYPGYNEDQIDGFRDVIADLQEFGSGFFSEDLERFRELAINATSVTDEAKSKKAKLDTYRYSGEARAKNKARERFRNGDYSGYLRIYDSWKHEEMITPAERKMARIARDRATALCEKCARAVPNSRQVCLYCGAPL